MTFITIIGLIAATLSTIAFIPQAMMTIRSKKTDDISLAMYCILTLGLFLWLLYGILTVDLPIIFANSLTLIFVVIILFIKVNHK